MHFAISTKNKKNEFIFATIEYWNLNSYNPDTYLKYKKTQST